MEGLSTWIKTFRELGKTIDTATMGEQVLDEQAVYERLGTAERLGKLSLRETKFTEQTLANNQFGGMQPTNEARSHWFDDLQHFSPGHYRERHKITCDTWNRLNAFIDSLDAEDKKQLTIQEDQ